ncbi:uncharacterized protein LOC132902110 [Amyelois transitella]|uniref:uncharacterized protein LOC132901752 n=1 Tax=Amyelois transitella TaxID=680683 RepID=UPI00298F4407|nr:uncharacterized protein LOC132901752 [Amyelois transitella]XP_060801484.1 uncharacterized protein LOC132901752 [Amyelois transitella]XP_060801931.1 uncharacterized protein LOC132902110 [Amyelois transitella]XP_060801932.1 uncharacterized protein LOC132902110 [Amyelois transitella]
MRRVDRILDLAKALKDEESDNIREKENIEPTVSPSIIHSTHGANPIQDNISKKSGEKYNVNELSYHDFISLKKLANDLKMKTITKISEMKVIKIEAESPDILYYKNSFADEDFSTLKLLKTIPILPPLKPAY